jgi:Cysteine rich repeat
MAANIETGEGQSAGGAAGSDDKVNEQLRLVFKRRAIYNRLLAIENQTKKRSSRGFTRYLLAICIGVAATLAWQSYGEAAKQMFAATAPELGWSPETKQMIANWVEQLGWTKPPATPAVRSSATETPQAAPEVHQIAMDLTALRQTVAQISVSQDQMARKVDTLQAANQEILVKSPEPPPPPPIAAAPAVAGRPAPGGAPHSENTQNTAPTSASLALRASCGPDVQRLCRGIPIENGDVIKCLSSHRIELSPTCDLYFNEMPVHRAAQTTLKR